MTIREAAYVTCKAIVRAPRRDDIRALISNLTSTRHPLPPGRADRSLFGYYARKQSAQYCGYLLVDQLRPSLAARPLPIVLPPLETHERDLLRAAHAELAIANAACVASVSERFPNLSSCLVAYDRLPALEAPPQSEGDVFSDGTFGSVVAAFESHPGIRTLLDSPGEVIESLAIDRVWASVRYLERELSKAGPGRAPDWLVDLMHNEPRSSDGRTQLRIIGSVVALRASLRILNQMVFQASLADTPPILSQDNVIDLKHLGTSYAGSGVSVVFQPMRTLLLLSVGDLALLKPVSGTAPVEGLVTIESTKSSFSGEFGSREKITGRIVDTNLNPLGDFAFRV